MRYLSYLYRNLSPIVALLLPVVFLLALPMNVKANAAAKEQLKQANEAFTANNYQKAAELYEAVVSSEFESAALYYNLGNAYYQQQQTAKALLNYERALRLQPHNKNIQNNLQLAKARITQPVDELPEIFYRGCLWNNVSANRCGQTQNTNLWGSIDRIDCFYVAHLFCLLPLPSRNQQGLRHRDARCHLFEKRTRRNE